MNLPHEECQELAEFQTALLDLLHQPLATEEILVRLRDDPRFAPYADYIATFEPRMVEVAAELTKKWGNLHDDGTNSESNG